MKAQEKARKKAQEKGQEKGQERCQERAQDIIIIEDIMFQPISLHLRDILT